MFVGCVTIIVTIIFVAKSSTAQRDCPTPEGAQGTCIDIQNCASILKLVSESATLQEAEIDNLRKSQCGFEGNSPKVCCPKIAQETTTTKEEKISGLNSTLSTSPPDVSNHPNLGLINHRNCGVFIEQRILPGVKALILDYPWMALISYTVNNKPNQFRCEGSLINKRYVVTAAHCVTGLNPEVILTGVRLGEYDLSTEIDCDEEDFEDLKICADKYQDFSIEHFYVHNEYRKEYKYRNDIALIRINRDADLQRNNVKPICLPTGNSAIRKSKKVTVTGWGTSEIGSKSGFLLQMTQEILPEEKCAQAYQNHNNKNINNKTMHEILLYKQFCVAAGIKNPMEHPFPGGDGGPVQYSDEVNHERKFILHGILAFGFVKSLGDVLVRDPYVYTEVSYYMDWILDTIGDAE